MTLHAMRANSGVRWLAWILSAAMISFGGAPAAFAAEICGPDDLADAPLELLGGSGPPPLFLIVMDNTVTMDYELMTGGPDNGRLPTPSSKRAKYSIAWVYRTNQHNVNAPVIENVEYYGAWKGMSYTQNKLFYNPNVTYAPWPRWAECANATVSALDAPSNRKPSPPDATTNGINAHVDRPRVHPMSNANVYDLTQLFGLGFGEGDPYEVLGSVSRADQTQNNNTWMVLGDVSPVPSNPADPAQGPWFSFPDGFARIYVSHQVMRVNVSNADEFFAGPVRLIPSDGSAPIHIDYRVADLTQPANGIWMEYPPASPYGYLTDAPGLYTATWIADGLNPALTYRVETKWNAYLERASRVDYQVTRPRAGRVNVIRRHFYLESADGFPYLIELQSVNNARFFKIDESRGTVPGKVEIVEMIATTWADLPADIKAVIPAPGAGVYAAQLQNFANWFSFYRKRHFAAKNAIGVTIDEMDNIMIGIMTTPPTDTRECRWVDVEFDGRSDLDRSLDLMNFTYVLPAPGGNPNFANTILDAGRYFNGQAGQVPRNTSFTTTIGMGGSQYTDLATTYPYFTEAFGGHCQHAFALIITDGGSTGSSSIPNHDGNKGYPFADTYQNTMADGAMYYYATDLQPSLPNHVPTNYMDQADWQHMVTYGVTFGVDGLIRQDYRDCNALCTSAAAGCCPASWPNPWTVNNNAAYEFSALDDLYHATVNSRGIYLYASNPQELVEQLRLIKSDIERRQGAAAAVTTNAVQRQIGSTIYQGVYHSGTWWGDLQAKDVDPDSGAVGVTLWRAQDQLAAMNYTTRKIFTNVGGTAKDLSAAAGDIGLTNEEMDFLLGGRGNEGTLFRERQYILGDIVHSEPFYHNGVLYIGANDGMMHAFDAANGNELFAYVPSMVHDNLYKLTLNSFIDQHQYYVNASPHVRTIAGTSYLAGGLAKGGKGVYCLKVNTAKTNPTAAGVFNWERDASADDNMGYVYGRAYVVNTKAGPAVIFGNGYASVNKTSALYVLSAEDGSIIRKFDTGVTGGADKCNGMASPALINVDTDDKVDYIYAGDLDGNLWKFDLTDADSNNWSISYGGNPFFKARDETGAVQPITTEPDVMNHCDLSRKGYIVVFGTGRYLNEDDLDINVASQVMYGLYDWEDDWLLAGKNAADKFLGAFEPNGGLSNVTASLLKQEKLSTVTINGTDYLMTSNNPINFVNPMDETGDHAGWYYPVPGTTERMVRDPIIIAGIVYFVTNTMNAQICVGTGGSYLYALDACSGSRPNKPQFDLDGDGRVDADDTIDGEMPSAQYFDRTLFDPVAVGDILYINDTFGNIIEQPIPPNPPRMNYWLLGE